MTEQRLFAAFYLSLPHRLSPADVADVARRAGVGAIQLRDWGPPGQPTLLGRWVSLDCEGHILSLAYYDVLLLTFRQDEFYAHLRGGGDDAPGLLSCKSAIIDAFADACRSLGPVSALLTSYAWVDPRTHLEEVENDVLGGNISRVARGHVWLLYVKTEDLAILRAADPSVIHDIVPVNDVGAVVVTSSFRDPEDEGPN